MFPDYPFLVTMVRAEPMKKEVKSIKSGKMPEGITRVENYFSLSFKDPIVSISDCTNDRGTLLAYDEPKIK